MTSQAQKQTIMASATSKLVWLNQLVRKLGFGHVSEHAHL